ncbi:MAG: hypothetical protein ACLQPD_07945 [Desulfomonilaceae bacterium]
MTTKPKPKTIDDWRKERIKKAKREGGYILIPMELFNGEAFHALSKSEKLILIECLAQLRYAPKNLKKRKALTDQRLFKCGLGHLLNGGEFGLPTKYLQERGIKGEDTISNAKKRLVQIGFFDVVVQGSFTKAGRFRYSDRWRSYNSGNLFREKDAIVYDGILPGYCHYPNIIQFNEERTAERTICSDEPKNPEMNDPDPQLNLSGDNAEGL